MIWCPIPLCINCRRFVMDCRCEREWRFDYGDGEEYEQRQAVTDADSEPDRAGSDSTESAGQQNGSPKSTSRDLHGGFGMWK